ncbi:uncharacterized protein [Chironomus tepperi]|uniref:uncharacterized protein isoform X1 n=1 Tax=Chironomus tepperi TaxID=113505 RepID=UPI00391FC0D1
MTCENHSIEIKHINENTCFSRKIILIIGTIKDPCDHQVIEYSYNSSDIVKQSIFNGNFKILLRLTEDTTSTLKIKYCQSEVDVSLLHKSIDPVIYDVKPLYIVPKNHDGKFQCDDNAENYADIAAKKIDLMMELSQCVFSTKIIESEKEEWSFSLEKCEIFNSDLDVEDVRTMDQFELYDKIAAELIDKFGDEALKRRKFVGFMSCTRFLGLDPDEYYNYVNIKNKTQASPSLSTGFLALLGNGSFYALPNDLDEVIEAFQNKKIINVAKLLDDSNYRRTYGGCFATFLGSLIHEMGHIFDLGHTNSGLMGTDIDYVHRFFLCQYFTEIMPKRNISNCQQMIKDENVLSNRITKIKKNGIYMEKYHEQKNNDLTFFEPNCLITLMNHKWFSQNANEDEINFDEAERTVDSKNSLLVLVEIRESENKNSILRKFWDLRNDKINQFQLPNDTILENVTIFAMNGNGVTLRKHVNTK